MAAHAYWDICLPDNNGDGSWVSGVEVEMMTTVGGSDVCTGGTAIGSNGYYAISNAFDNNTGTIFAQYFGTGYYPVIGYAFASPVDIVQFTFTCEDTGFTNRAPKILVLRYSDDGKVWYPRKIVTNQTGWTGLQKRTFNVFAGSLSGNITESLAITDWSIRAVRCSDGVTIGEATSTGSTYTVNCTSLDACNLVLSPKIDSFWVASAVISSDQVTAGYYVTATNPDTTQFIFKVTTAGTFGGTEPTWNTTIGGTTTSGTATLTCIAALVNPIVLGPRMPS